MRRSLCALTVFSLCLCALLSRTAPRAAADDVAIHIGMVQTFFHDVPKGLIPFATDPFKQVMRAQAGINGTLEIAADAQTVAAELDANKIQLGVFHGHEFARIQCKYPGLKPLMLAVHSQHPVTAFVLVQLASPAVTFADLKGKDFAMPKRTKEHCRLFLEREAGGASKEFFGHVLSSTNVETALDDLVEGKFEATIVDSIGLEFYRDLKPGRFNKLKILKQSDPFPSAIIAYKPGAMDAATVKRISDGLASAHMNAQGQAMMRMWGITHFESPQATFNQTLVDCLKAYPTSDSK